MAKKTDASEQFARFQRRDIRPPIFGDNPMSVFSLQYQAELRKYTKPKKKKN